MVERRRTVIVDGGAARIAELEAENERLKAEVFQNTTTIVGMETKVVEIVEDAIRRCRELHEYAGRPAWEKAMEDAILSALEPADPVEPDFAGTIAAVIKDECEGGAAAGWRSCSG